MSGKLIMMAAMATGVAMFAPAHASAQSWGVYVGSGYPNYYRYDPYDGDRRADWRERRRWAEHERWEQRERWERERARHYWDRERWEHRDHWRDRGDDDDDDDN